MRINGARVVMKLLEQGKTTRSLRAVHASEAFMDEASMQWPADLGVQSTKTPDH